MDGNYTRTRFEVGHPIKYEKMKNRVILIDPNETENDRLAKQLENRDPILREVISEIKLDYGEIINIESVSIIRAVSDGEILNVTEVEWFLLGQEEPKEDGGDNKMEKTTKQAFEMLRALRDQMARKEKYEFLIAANTLNLNIRVLRKMLQCIFSDGNNYPNNAKDAKDFGGE